MKVVYQTVNGQPFYLQCTLRQLKVKLVYRVLSSRVYTLT